MKKMTLALLLDNYYSLVTIKLLLEYIMSAYLSVRFINNDEDDLITVRR
jgi:hypothetical protein